MPISIDRELNDVLVFLAVVDAGSFTAAGKVLGMPTSTVSRRVARLEEALDARLLQRTTRKLSLTDAGRTYHEHATRSFEELEAAENMIAETLDAPRGRVRMTVPLEHEVTMPVVVDFCRSYPEVEVDLHFSSQSVNILEEGFDVALTAGALVSESVVAHHLMDSHLRLVASPSYLEAQGEPTTPKELSQHRCIFFGGTRGRDEWVFAKDGEVYRVRTRGPLVLNHLSAAKDAALAGLGLARLPELSVGRQLHEGSLRVVLADFEPPPVPVWISHAGGRHQAPAVRALVSFFREHFLQHAMPAATGKG